MWSWVLEACLLIPRGPVLKKRLRKETIVHHGDVSLFLVGLQRLKEFTISKTGKASDSMSI